MMDRTNMNGITGSRVKFIRWLLAIAGVTDLFFIGLAVFSLLQARWQYEERAEITTQNLSYALAGSLSDSIDKIELTLLTLADEVEKQLAGSGIDEKRLNAFIVRHHARLPILDGLRVVNAQGENAYGIGIAPGIRTSVADRAYFVRLRSDPKAGLVISEPVMGRVSKKWSIILARRTNRPDGSFAGLVYGTITLEQFLATFASLDVGKHGSILLFDDELALIARYPKPQEIGKAVGKKNTSPELQNGVQAQKDAGSYRTDRSFDNVQRAYSFRKVSNRPLYVVVGLAHEDYLGAWRKEATEVTVLVALFILGTLISSWLGYRGWIRRANALQALALQDEELRTALQAAEVANRAKSAFLANMSHEIRTPMSGVLGMAGLPLVTPLTDRQRHYAERIKVNGESLLVVDDVPANIDILLGTLGEAYHVRVATNGSAALGSVKKARPDLILLDVMMPGMDGFEVCRRLKDDPSARNIPIIFLTAMTDDADQERGLGLGAVDYITKPFNPAIVRARVRNHLELKNYREHLEEMVSLKTDELARTKNFLENIFNSSLDGIITTDVNGTILYTSPRIKNIMGYEQNEVMGKQFRTYFGRSLEETERIMDELMSKGETQAYEVRSKKKSGEAMDINLSIALLRNEKSEIIGKTIIYRDITEEKKMAVAMEQARLRAEASNKAKSEFLANMSHEIRTPLNGILGMAEVCLETTLDKDQRHIVDTITKEATSLLDIINEILDFSKIEAGKMEIEQVPFDLKTLFNDLIESYLRQTTQKGLELISSIAPETPTRITGDPGRLRQILRNLIGNAIKFTHAGRIAVEVAPDGDTLRQSVAIGERIKLRFLVKDTGIGIPKEKQSLVFESFTQADGSTTRKYGGTGLGTTIAKQLAELMGGEIGLESEVGKGSTFWFTAVFSKTSAADLDRRRAGELRRTIENLLTHSLSSVNNSEFDIVRYAHGEEAGKEIYILLAEDYPTNQAIAKRHLEHAGYRVDLAQNGEIAFAAFRSKHYDLILMDMEMPVMDGCQATKAIREFETERAALKDPNDPETMHRVPIIAMTAHAFREQKELCLQAGMDDFLSKPVTKRELLSMVGKRLVISASISSILSGGGVHNHAAMTRQEGMAHVVRSGHQPIDLERAIEEFEGDKELLAEVIAGFIEKVNEQIGTIREALSCDDAETVRREAHSIKGGASGLTAADLSKVAGDLESKGKSKELSGASEILDALEIEFIALRQHIEENFK